MPDDVKMMHEPKKTLEQIVCETGRYPIDSFLFIQECVAAAAEAVHGPPSAEMQRIAQFMARKGLSPDQLRSMHEEGGLPEKIAAIIDQMGGPEKLNRHVTGQQLCRVIRDVALRRWGLMARAVLARWQIHRTEDIGAIVFALVNNDWLQKQPTDTVEDFNAVFDFRVAFDKTYRFDDAA